MSAFETVRRVRILDFDIENRPLSYWYSDRPTAEVTAIAAGSGSLRSIWVGLLGRDDPLDMLTTFRAMYDAADIVTGHYIRKHDLRILNGAMLEYGLPPLSPKLTIDTKLDLVTQGDLPATQEHLAEMFGVRAPKVHMTQVMWRDANRLTESGLRATESRVKGDVIQHMQLRTVLAEKGLLGPPKKWSP
jgi:hypothetical protein